MRCMGRHRKVGIAERWFKHLAQIELGVMTQAGSGMGRRLFALDNPDFSTVAPINLLAGAAMKGKNHA